MTLSKNQSGQISIFFSASLVVLISIIAFVINVGLFVKAKINLQNAVDAAAYSGAAVQARQLSKIAYLNWEMRNIYKEWLYKYYVLGNLNINDVENPNSPGDAMSFRLEPDVLVLKNNLTFKDPYNLPATCLHLAGSETNICKKYAIPALPEFGSHNMVGAEESSRALIDRLIGAKTADCVDRSGLNMLATTNWTYNILSQNTTGPTLAEQAPAILSDRQGAWPQAIELAIRIRNLEKAMNKMPSDEPVCIDTGGGVSCTKSINDITSSSISLGNERIVKAFYSAFRNIGNNVDNRMKSSFTLTEIKPKVQINTTQESASNFLIKTPYLKPYVDLKLMMVNYALFYAAMISRGSKDESGGCDVSKIAIPVPGYPLGFYKNPDVLTYYAVKGQAKFLGMFNPFDTEDIVLTAYAAAKPFGGRIGPMLFLQRANGSAIFARNDTKRSVPYFSSITTVGAPYRGRDGLPGGNLEEGQYEPGAPLPINPKQGEPPGPFWLKSASEAIGGWTASPDAIQFGLPNMVYDYVAGFNNTPYTWQNEKINIIPANTETDSDKPVGLYNKKMFALFKGDVIKPGISVTPQMMSEEVARVRAATQYDAANYLVPTPDSFNEQKDMDSFGLFTNSSTTLDNGVKVTTGHIFAPLFSPEQEDILYRSNSEVISAITDFMRMQAPGMLKYRAAMNMAAKKIYDMNKNLTTATSGSAYAYENAAKAISDISTEVISGQDMRAITSASPQSCQSLTGKFLYFYFGHQDTFSESGLPSDIKSTQKKGETCPQSLGDMLADYFSSGALSNPRFSASHYIMDLSWRDNGIGTKAFSAYVPGPLTGIATDGMFYNPLANNSTKPESMRRNTYSTKFVTLKSLMAGDGPYAQGVSHFPIYSEGNLSPQGNPDSTQASFLNPIDGDQDGNLSSIKH